MRVLGLILCLSMFALSAAAQETPAAATPEPSTMNNWDVCNETSFVLRFASAFIRSDRMQVAGWTQIQPGGCVTLTPPKDSPRFLFAESLPIHKGGIREWKGNFELCAAEEDFTSDATDKCQLKNLETRDYFAVKPSERQTAFIEPSDFGVTAEIAGLQRLLQDAGYKITRIDGLSGRRTLRTIASAKSDLEQDKNATNQELMAALIPKAENTRDTIGLDLCNDGTERIYTAIAIQQDGNWTSWGWWPVDVGACVKPFDRSLIGTQAHIYALQESKTEDGKPNPDRRLRSEVVTPAPFCIAESRFAALGREKCLEQGYAAVDFRPVPDDVDVQVIRLTDADFVEGGGDGLRR